VDGDIAADSVEDSWDRRQIDCGMRSGRGDFNYREECGEL